MLLEEARWLGDILSKLDIETLSPLIDLGSSTRTFRTVDQPYIEAEVFAPIKKRGCEICHVDIKAADGVDVVADIFSDNDHGRLRDIGARSLLSASMLEHVANPDAALGRFLDLLPIGGILLLTVPNSFPRHADPIDTMFRPSPSVLAEMLRGNDVRRCEIVTGKTLIAEIKSRRSMRKRGEPAFGKGWKPRAQVLWHIPWLFQPYRMTCAVAVKL